MLGVSEVLPQRSLHFLSAQQIEFTSRNTVFSLKTTIPMDIDMDIWSSGKMTGGGK